MHTTELPFIASDLARLNAGSIALGHFAGHVVQWVLFYSVVKA